MYMLRKVARKESKHYWSSWILWKYDDRITKNIFAQGGIQRGGNRGKIDEANDAQSSFARSALRIVYVQYSPCDMWPKCFLGEKRLNLVARKADQMTFSASLLNSFKRLDDQLSLLIASPQRKIQFSTTSTITDWVWRADTGTNLASRLYPQAFQLVSVQTFG